MNKKVNLAEHAPSPGTILRGLRIGQGLKLSDVSERTGIPVSTLSKVETGKMDMSMDRLLRISLALEVNIADLIGTGPAEPVVTSDRRRSVTRKSETMSVSANLGVVSYHAHDLLEKLITPMVAEITARSLEEFGEFHRHKGEEWVLVLAGELALHTDTYAPIHLKQGESVYFDSGMGHAYVAVGDEPCRVASVFTRVSPTGMKTFEPVTAAVGMQSILSGNSLLKKNIQEEQ